MMQSSAGKLRCVPCPPPALPVPHSEHLCLCSAPAARVALPLGDRATGQVLDAPMSCTPSLSSTNVPMNIFVPEVLSSHLKSCIKTPQLLAEGHRAGSHQVGSHISLVAFPELGGARRSPGPRVAHSPGPGALAEPSFSVHPTFSSGEYACKLLSVNQ